MMLRRAACDGLKMNKSKMRGFIQVYDVEEDDRQRRRHTNEVKRRRCYHVGLAGYWYAFRGGDPWGLVEVGLVG